MFIIIIIIVNGISRLFQTHSLAKGEYTKKAVFDVIGMIMYKSMAGQTYQLTGERSLMRQ